MGGSSKEVQEQPLFCASALPTKNLIGIVAAISQVHRAWPEGSWNIEDAEQNDAAQFLHVATMTLESILCTPANLWAFFWPDFDFSSFLKPTEPQFYC